MRQDEPPSILNTRTPEMITRHENDHRPARRTASVNRTRPAKYQIYFLFAKNQMTNNFILKLNIKLIISLCFNFLPISAKLSKFLFPLRESSFRSRINSEQKEQLWDNFTIATAFKMLPIVFLPINSPLFLS